MAELILVISVLCKTNITNLSMPKEDKIVCIEQFVNCLVGPNGEYAKDKLKTCEAKYDNYKRNSGGKSE